MCNVSLFKCEVLKLLNQLDESATRGNIILLDILGSIQRGNVISNKTLDAIHKSNELLAKIAKCSCQQSKFSAIQFTTGDSPMQTNNLVMNVGQTSTASPITFLADGTTPSGATYSNAVYTFNDPSATVVLNPDGVTALVTAVAASTAGPVSGTVSFTATDTDGAVSQWTNIISILVNGVAPPTQLSQSSAIQFSDPA